MTDKFMVFDVESIGLHGEGCADVTHPDMRLMAAAPDLLAALQELRYACTDKAEAMADAAIAKALGHNAK